MDIIIHRKFDHRLIRYAVTIASICALQGPANAQDAEVAEGEQLYTAQCKLCHGDLKEEKKSDAASPHLRLAMQSSGETRVDASLAGVVPGNHGQLAFAPPFGPHLRGVYGRPAGSVEDYQYSTSFLKALKGMEWNEAALNVWITNPQAWVPGVYMFYKQPDAEVRRKIILYLKANP